MINKVTLIGRVGKEPEKRETTNSQVVNFSVATSDKYKDKAGEWQENTEWHNIVAWGKTAEWCKAAKGDLVYIEGKLQTRSYDDKEGNKKYITEVNANVIRKIYTGQNSNTQDVQEVKAEVLTESANDLPF